MTEENHDFLPLTEALAELNKDILGKDSGAACYASSTAYARAATGAIPVQKFGRTYFVRRADIPLIASRLPLGRRRHSSPSAA